MGTIKLCSLLTIAVTITSQSTRCVWFSIDEWDHVNGEYIENGTWYNGKNTYPKWKRESITCPDTQQYLFGTYYSKDKMSFWSIYPSLSNDLSRNPDCGNDDKMASDPSLCKKGWTVWQNDKDYTDIPLQVADSICPSLPCVHIQVTNSGVSACNQVFSKDPSKDHVYYHTDQGTTTYLFFNIYTFKWHCSYTLDHTYCGDDTGINALLSSKSDGWDEVNLNAQFTLRMDNAAVATFACLDGTLAPTQSTDNPSPAPSPQPTPSPSSSPSPAPTDNPSRNPTPAPTPAPTHNPTPSPTPAPTQAPTDHPTKHPTTRAPTPPGTMVCGEMDVGEYNGEVITFMVSHTARGDITFDASQSQFTILNMEATTELNTVLLDTDEDNDGIIVIEDTPAGNYKFSVFGGTDTGMVYWVMTTCTSYDPTNAPTSSPSPAPTHPPTDAPTNVPSKFPTRNPTPAPTEPTIFPTTQPTKNPTRMPTITPTALPSAPPTNNPTGLPSISPVQTSETPDDRFGGDNDGAMDIGTVILLTMIGLTLLVCGMVLIVWFVYYRKKQSVKTNKKMQMNRINSVPSSPVNDTFAMDSTNALGELGPGAVFSTDVLGPGAVNTEARVGERMQNRLKYTHGLKKAIKQDVAPVSNVMAAHLQDVANIEVPDQPQVNVDMDHTGGVYHDDDYEDETSSSGGDSIFREMPEQKTIGMEDGLRKDGALDDFGDQMEAPGQGYGLCADCMQNALGRVYDGDGLFYCEECWASYDEIPKSFAGNQHMLMRHNI
eukprot:1068777_1